MKRFLKSNIYSVCFRNLGPKSKYLFEDKSAVLDFRKIPNPFLKWAADPFPLVFQGKKYIFAEIAGYFGRKGEIGYICLDDKKPKWHIVIKSPYHMSFPNVVFKNGKIGIVPETYQDHCIRFYSCVEFPQKWEPREKLFSDGEFVMPVDTSFLDKTNVNQGFFSYLKNNGEHYLSFFKQNQSTYEISCFVKDEKRTMRPAGNVFCFKGDLILPTQDCSVRYGGRVLFSRVVFSNDSFALQRVGDVCPEALRINQSLKKCVGCHTYNYAENLEVIDIIEDKISLISILGKLYRAVFKRKKV